MIQIKLLAQDAFETIYFQLLAQLYPNDAVYSYYRLDMQNAFGYVRESVHQKPFFFVAYVDSEPAGCLSLIVDDRLGTSCALFSFFECVPEYEVFAQLWANIQAKSREVGVTELRGPVQGVIWFQHRVVSYSGEAPLFPSEPLSQLYYKDFFAQKSPSKVIECVSVTRREYGHIIDRTEPAYQKASELGVQIVNVSNAIDLPLMQSIYELSNRIFSSNWCFVSMSFNEFLSVYNPSKISNFVGSVYIATYEGAIVGFCMNIEIGPLFIMKTIGVDPQLHQQGIASALVHVIHADAQAKGVQEITYALINKDNNIKYFPTDKIELLREYQSYEYQL